MSKKLPSIITQAIQTIEGFDKVYKVLHQHTVIQGRSQSTFENYIRRITRISLHFNKLPEHISDDEINEYLTALALSSESPSRSSFKHMVYGLRYYFRHMNLPQRVVNLPSIKKEIKLPVILNRSELIELFKAPTLLKHRVLLALAYSAGLRSQEVANLKLSDIDYERKTIHIH
jgi:site-specific recombinase XerD